ncbi:hypothetical protein DVH05_017492 [Phytophthora capsici]|nr:hypothetical protein DVH05_017492 [Phytophthora capsici]
MASPALSIPYLRLVLAGGTVLTYTNPKPWTCLQIHTCSYWHRTVSIHWKHITKNQYGIFYASNRCSTKQEYYNAKGIYGHRGGNYTFETPRAFGSIAIGVYDKAEAFTNEDNCPKDKENVALNESGVYVTSASEDGSFVDGGLSSNWNDSLS